jgi:ornithine carbamoyltransferase
VTRHLLEIDDLTADELHRVLDLAEDPAPNQVLAGKGVALVFQKPSARTRNSMEMAVVQLGGHPVSVRGDEVGIDTRESAEDVVRTLACYHAAVGARVFSHGVLERMATVSPVPVVNLLSDEAHPLQALADLLTLRQEWGGFEGRVLAYVGDGNNVCRSLGLAGALAGLEVRAACPPGYDVPPLHADRLKALGAEVITTARPEEAVAGADAVYTDVWASMGQEDSAGDRRRAFEGFGVDERLMAAASPGALFLHCLPAHRGEEVAAAVVDGPASRVWAQAANRMHAARGLLRFLLVEAA